jgi:spermidine synthase
VKIELRFSLLLLCFFLSGFAALLYETAWAREFAFIFGTSELAVVSVLAAYMAGLAFGAGVAARWVARIRRPVLVYAVLELGIAASALAVPWAIRAALWLQTVAMGGHSAPPDEASVGGAFFYVGCSFAILLVPTSLMGATLPLLARHAVRREDEIGRRTGTLYAVNTAGAVLGTAAAGFVLLPMFGLRITVYIGAATNALIFLAAAALAPRRQAAAAVPSPVGVARRFHWILPLTALSGAVSFSYEVIWMRLLGIVLGGTIQAFSTMLASFLLGIALGSAIAARLASDTARAARGFAIAQIGTATLSLVAFSLVNQLPELAQKVGAGRAGSAAANALIAALVLFPAALCIGAVFPFAVRLLARHESHAASAAARVYAWNTLGAISGALASGFLLLPALQFAGSMRLAGFVNLALAATAAVLARPRMRGVIAVALCGLAALLVQRPETPWRVLRHSQTRTSAVSGEIAYYGVGRSSTVILFQQPTGWRLTTNGQPESRIDRAGPAKDQYPTARWLAMLPVLLRPEIRSMLMIGLGGGLSLEAVPSSIASIDVIELEREVVRAHEVLETLRGSSPLSDPRARIVVNDARGALALTNARFDAIVSQPSHPWTAGASHLYTREFFELASKHLEPGGVFVQWIGLAFVDEGLLRSLVATLLEVFPHVGLYRPVPGAVLFAASDTALDPTKTAARALAAAPADFARFGLRTVEDVAASWALETSGASRFSRGAAINTDDRNGLATRSAKLMGRAIRARVVTQLMLDDDPLGVTEAELDHVYLVRRLAANFPHARGVHLAETISDPVARMTTLGWAMSRQNPRRAAVHFRSALERDPTDQSARFGFLRTRRVALEANDPSLTESAGLLEGAAGAVVAGWRHLARRDWTALRALEPELAGAQLLEPAQPDAERLRVLWRVESGDPELRTEAVEIAHQILLASSQVEDLMLGARAYSAAGQSRETLRLLDLVSQKNLDREARRAAYELLERLPPEVDGPMRGIVRRRLGRRAARPR